MSRVRPTINNPGVGDARYESYKKTIDRYHEAMNASYYVECIALMEGLISDRMESLANELSDGKYSYKTLGCLINYLQQEQQSKRINETMINCVKKIDIWRANRNKAIHELPKLSENLHETFDVKYQRLCQVAKDGYDLFREFDNNLREFRKFILSQKVKITSDEL